MSQGRPKHRSSTTMAMYDVAAALGDDALQQLCTLARQMCDPGEVLLGQTGPEGGVGFRSWVATGSTTPSMLLPLCGYALHRDTLFHIDDLREHDALARDPLVAGEMGLRSLMGAPLRRSDGTSLGAMVLFHTEPRTFDAASQRAFAMFADQAARQVEMRERVAAIRSHHEGHLRRLWTLEAVFRAARHFAIVAVDEQGRVRLVNEGAERMLNKARTALVGRVDVTRFHRDPGQPDAVVELAAILGDAAETGRFARTWDWLVEGARKPVQSVVSPMRTENDELIGYVIIARDLTEERRLERVREDFVTTVSHELRTPLTSIRGSLGLVVGGMVEVPEKAQKLLSIAHSNCERLVNIVNDILDLSKLEAGKLELSCQRVAVPSVLADALEQNAPYAQQCEVLLELAAGAAEVAVWADPLRLQQVLSNLVSNAAKVSPVGSTVTLGADRRSRGETVRLWVRDRGPGVPDDVKDRLFTRFASVRHGQSGGRPQTRSTGLGLSIVKNIVEQHGGKVGFDTEVGAGSTFWLDLPVMPAR